MNRFFKFIRYYPLPESDEFINVALLFQDGTRVRVTYLDNFPRLKSFITANDLGILRYTLKETIKYINDIEIHEYIDSLSPMLELSGPREITSEINSNLIEILKKKYLISPKKEKKSPREKKVDTLRRKRIKDLMFNQLQIPSSYVKDNVSPKHVLNKVSLKHIHISIPKVMHAVEAKDTIILLDGVDLHERNASSIENQAEEIGRAFWHYRRINKKVKELENKEIITTAIMFNGHSPEEQPLQDAYEYIMEDWQNKTDMVIEADKYESVTNLRKLTSKMFNRSNRIANKAKIRINHNE